MFHEGNGAADESGGDELVEGGPNGKQKHLVVTVQRYVIVLGFSALQKSSVSDPYNGLFKNGAKLLYQK